MFLSNHDRSTVRLWSYLRRADLILGSAVQHSGVAWCQAHAGRTAGSLKKTAVFVKVLILQGAVNWCHKNDECFNSPGYDDHCETAAKLWVTSVLSNSQNTLMIWLCACFVCVYLNCLWGCIPVHVSSIWFCV